MNRGNSAAPRKEGFNRHKRNIPGQPHGRGSQPALQKEHAQP